MIFASARVAGDGLPEIAPNWRDALVSAGLVLAMGSVLIAMDPRVRRIGPQEAAAPPEKSSQIVAKLDPPVIAADEPAEVRAEDEALRAALVAFALSKVANPPPAEAAPLPPQRAFKPVVARGAKQPPARAVSAPAKRLRPAEWREPPRPPAGRPGWLQAADPRQLITLAPDRQRLAQNVTALARSTAQTLNAGMTQAQNGAAQAARAVSAPVARLLR